MEDKTKSPFGWVEKVTLIFLGVTALASLIISLGDFIGVVDNIIWLKERLVTILLLLMSSIGIYLALERMVFFERTQNQNQEKIGDLTFEINNLTSTIIKSLDGVELREFSSTVAGMRYVIKRVGQAKKQINDLTWSHALGIGHGLNITEALEKKYQDQITNAATKIPYREVFIFQRHGRLEKLQKRIGEKSPGYSCAYYDKTEIPLLQFMIIDDIEVIFISGG